MLKRRLQPPGDARPRSSELPIIRSSAPADGGVQTLERTVDWQEKRAVEVESIWGEPWRQGHAAGAALPKLELLYRLLLPLTTR